MRVGVIIQARMGSTRLRGKILKSLPAHSDITALEQVIRRVKNSKKCNDIIIATTINASDDDIIKVVMKEGIKYFRGSEDDVLSRYYLSAKENNIDVVVRITSDCPCIDPVLLDYLITYFLDNDYDYVSNTLERTYPRGLDVEVFSFIALERAYNEGTREYEREHVTPYINLNPDKFRLKNIAAEGSLKKPEIRITLDTQEDYLLLCAVYDYLYEKNPLFGTDEIIGLFDQKPWLYQISREVSQKTFDSLQEEIYEAIRILGGCHNMENAQGILKEYLKNIK